MHLIYLAHEGVDHAEEASAKSSGLFETLTHQPTPLSLLLIAFVVFVLFTMMRFMKINFLKRVMILIPVLIAIAILYLPHNATVTSIVLSFGFVLTFLLVFTMLAGKPK